MTDKPTAPSDGTGAEAVTRLLHDAYDLTATGVHRLPVGQGAVNYRVDCGHETVFAKAYPDGTDLDGERAGIGQSELAGRHGVPVARVRPSRDGEPITVGPHGAVSVWPWVDGATMTEGLQPAQQRAAGAVPGTHPRGVRRPSGRPRAGPRGRRVDGQGPGRAPGHHRPPARRDRRPWPGRRLRHPRRARPGRAPGGPGPGARTPGRAPRVVGAGAAR